MRKYQDDLAGGVTLSRGALGSPMTSGKGGPHRCGVGEAGGRGKPMSAGHSLRRQNYSFVTLTPPMASDDVSPAMHFKRIVIAVATAVALTIVTFATISTLITGR